MKVKKNTLFMNRILSSCFYHNNVPVLHGYLAIAAFFQNHYQASCVAKQIICKPNISEVISSVWKFSGTSSLVPVSTLADFGLAVCL